jgi:hypothetical protein
VRGRIAALLAVLPAAAAYSAGRSGAAVGRAAADAGVVEGGVADGGAVEGGAGDGEAAGDAVDDAALPVGAPLAVQSGQWAWFDFPDSACDDGTPTGIGVYAGAVTDKLLLLFMGGGACWSYATCVVFPTSIHGPFGASEFASIVPNFAGSVLDSSSTANPFKDYTKVFVPYCTGDMHGGDAVTTYADDGGTKTVHHVGHANVLAYLARLAATFPAPSQVAVAGTSAGGGGALLNYPWVRGYWPRTSAMLVDDSLPLLEKDALMPEVRSAWFQNWNLADVTDPLCGAACQGDLSLAMKAVANRYPGDRMALLSSMQDLTISSYYQLSGTAFQADLEALTTDVLAPTWNFRHFYVPGASHTMLVAPANFTAQGTPLWTWLTQMATGDWLWGSLGP